ncbi:hypothetical protein LSAT2_004286 [Lamellibrachia satsuma]|nr:hypothetical protein LSAT2_004286 [Lamellibrachia satsuma]
MARQLLQAMFDIFKKKTPATTTERGERPFVVPPLPPSPTLSHFTSAEIHVLNDVFARQKQFDDEEASLTRVLERDLECYKARMLAKQKEATSTAGARDDDPSLCQLCLKPTYTSTRPTTCFDCGRRACGWCACFHWQHGGFDKNNEKGACRWQCHLCRKERRIRCRRGSWFHGEAAAPTVGIDWLHGNRVEVNNRIYTVREF